MLLGADFLRSHRVLIAHSQQQMYFTYAGGTVFRARIVTPCERCSADAEAQRCAGASNEPANPAAGT